MQAFEVYLNGRKLCVAGIGNDGVLSAIVNLVTRKRERDLFLGVGGLVSPKGACELEQQKPLRVGHEVLVRVVESTTVDEPAERQKTDSRKQLVSEKADVRAIAKKLGWTKYGF